MAKFRLPKSKCVKIERPKGQFDKRSFRYIKAGDTVLLIGCPKGQWSARAKKCKVGTRLHEKIVQAPKRGCPVRYKKG